MISIVVGFAWAYLVLGGALLVLRAAEIDPAGMAGVASLARLVLASWWITGGLVAALCYLVILRPRDARR